MKQLAILVSLLALAAPARAQSKNIHENTDPYTGLRTLFLEVSTRTCPGDPSRGAHDPEVHLLFTAMENPDHTTAYFVAPELDQASYSLNLRARDTMDTLTDGTVGTFATTAGSTTTNLYAGGHSYLHETIPFTFTPDALTRLSAAQWFQFRINGQRHAVQRCTDAKHLRDLAEFLNAASEYGPPDSTVPAVPSPFLEKVSPTTQLKTLTLANIPMQPCPGDPAPQDAIVTLSLSANQREAGRVWYYVTTDISHGATLNLGRGGSMPIQMDGTPGNFHTIKGSILAYAPDAAGNQVPHETTAFHVDQHDIIALSKLSHFELRIDTPSGPIRRCANAAQFRNLNDFIAIAMTYEPSHMATAAPPPR